MENTINLLKECDAGTKTAVNSIKEVLDNVKSENLLTLLTEVLHEHEDIGNEIAETLREMGGHGKDPNPMAESMSWMKTTFKLGMNDTDNTVADLITDGCNMGVKSLNKYLNQYSNADKRAKDITKRLIDLEKSLQFKLESFLCDIVTFTIKRREKKYQDTQHCSPYHQLDVRIAISTEHAFYPIHGTSKIQ